MSKKTTSIPVNNFGGEFDSGVFIEKIAFEDLPDFAEWGQPERHDRHSFFLLERGSVTIEIDFEQYTIGPAGFIYMHPNQVHRIVSFEIVTVVTWAINNESLNSEYLKLLEDISPSKPLTLNQEAFSIITETISLCLKLSERRGDKLYHSLLKDGFNTLIALVISQLLDQEKRFDRLSRFEYVMKAFHHILEREYKTAKRPAEYARKINISTSYLNECVKNTTGFSVTHHIQQRVILEAKRLLYHSDRSVKEIAAELGYDDYPYFSRLFTKITGISAQAFRDKNRD